LLQRNARRVIRVAGMSALTAGYTAVYAVACRIRGKEDAESHRQRWVRRWSRALLRLFAIDVTVHGNASVSDTGMLVVSNHRSPADILVLLNVFAGYMLSRADIANWPVIGPAANSVGTVYVDRDSASSSHGALQTISRLLSGARTVILFPEATIFEGDDVRPFKQGAFAAARRANAVVLPVGVAYESGSDAAAVEDSFVAHVARVAVTPRTRVTIRVGTPLRAADFAETDALASACRVEVQRLVHEARRIVDEHAPHAR
jgi:1-acyl-sn-glycerol-3-phosphate acyltransferase